jgi:hypothetical protein
MWRLNYRRFPALSIELFALSFYRVSYDSHPCQDAGRGRDGTIEVNGLEHWVVHLLLSLVQNGACENYGMHLRDSISVGFQDILHRFDETEGLIQQCAHLILPSGEFYQLHHAEGRAYKGGEGNPRRTRVLITAFFFRHLPV